MTTMKTRLTPPIDQMAVVLRGAPMDAAMGDMINRLTETWGFGAVLDAMLIAVEIAGDDAEAKLSLIWQMGQLAAQAKK